MSQPLRIAMWSGPRNISTAMMRAWENRGDCAVSDEPLYGAWLAASGTNHPMREEVIAQMETDWRRVVEHLTGPVPDARPIWYQKHMCHHLLDGMDTGWIDGLVNVFLIRDPDAVVASYLKIHAEVSPEIIGVPQQARLFDEVADRLGEAPPVIDSHAFLAAPEAHLRGLCDRLGIEFRPQMLTWPPGPRPSDGPWAPHWYQAVWSSTGFRPPGPPPDSLPGSASRVADRCRPDYERMRKHHIRVTD